MTNTIQLRYTNDGGNNYSDWRNLDCGETGDHLKPLIARRLGMTRHRIWETMDTSPVAQDVYGASVFLESE
jgi:hypothetical protein